jgi:hypothetical protein
MVTRMAVFWVSALIVLKMVAVRTSETLENPHGTTTQNTFSS